MKNKLLKKLKVLFVEDEVKISSLLKEAIGDEFYKFYTASDGEEGLEKFKSLSVDIVITDINMPRLDGLSMADKIKKISPATPLIILSAFSEQEKLFRAIDVGVTKYFLKPYDPDELLEYIIGLAPSLGEMNVELDGGFVYSKTSEALYKNDRYISLSKNELKFLQLLIKNMDIPIKDDLIKSHIWQEDVSDERLRTFVKRFRAKSSKSLLQNIKGVGYKLLT